MDSVSESQQTQDLGYVLYKRRWIVVLCLTIINVTNSILWLSYAPISNISAKYYNVSEKQINWFSLVFPISTVISGLVSVRLADKYGLRFSILLAAFMNGIGAAIRLADSFFKSYPLALSGQVIAALAQPILLSISTKVAETWFPERQRLLATSMSVMGSLLGQLIGSGITPLVTDGTSCGIRCMNIICTIPCIVSTFLALFAVRTAAPPTPPSGSAAITIDVPYLPVILKLISSWNFTVLMLATGSVLGISDVLIANMEEILCARGYDNDFGGYCSMVLLGCGIIGSAITCLFAGKRLKLNIAMKILIPLMVASLSAFVLTSRFDEKYLVFASSGLVGFFGYAAFPVGLELCAEYSFRVVPEATSTGFIIVSGHLQGLFYLLLREYASQNLDASDAKKEMCTHFKKLSGAYEILPQNDNVPLLVITGITILIALLFQTIFNIKFRRSEMDQTRIIGRIVDTQDDLDGMRRKHAWEASLIYS